MKKGKGKEGKGMERGETEKGEKMNCKLQFILSTRPTFKQLEQAVQYTYKLRLANRDSPPNESSPFREILVKLDRFQEIGLEE